MAEDSFARHVATIVGALGRAGLGAALLERLEVSVIDDIACALAGIGEPSTAVAMRNVKSYHRGRQAGLIGHRATASPMGAAFANATMMHAADFDDSSLSMYGHASAAVFPAALAAAELVRASGRGFLVALAAGIETEAVIGRIAGREQFARGWHTAASIGVIGAAAAASCALGLSLQQTTAAIGLAASRACGTRASVGTMNKSLQVGFASKSGLEAALLAADGAEAAARSFEGSMGYFALYDGSAVEQRGNGEEDPAEPEMLVPGLAHKFYPCSGDIHAALDAILALRVEHDLEAACVCNVLVQASGTAVYNPGFDDPSTATEARFSFRFCVAAALCKGKLGPAEFLDDVLGDATVRDLMRRIDVRPLPGARDPDTFCSPAEVEIVKRDGTVLRKRVEFMRGHPRNPMRRDDAAAKLRVCAVGVLDDGQIARLLSLVSRLATLPAVSALRRATMPVP